MFRAYQCICQGLIESFVTEPKKLKFFEITKTRVKFLVKTGQTQSLIHQITEIVLSTAAENWALSSQIADKYKKQKNQK